jgi:hypothetical protein
MDAATRAVLNETENLLIAETSREALAALDEDAAIELETRIRRTRDKYVSQYRRGASARVAEHGGRGRARPENTRALQKAEAFERALSQVSRRVAVLAAESAKALRAERLELARAAKQGDWPGAGEMVPGQRGPGSGTSTVPAGRTGDRALRNPASERDRAGTQAAGARQQVKRDSKRAASR